jgi:hypothetical protein
MRAGLVARPPFSNVASCAQARQLQGVLREARILGQLQHRYSWRALSLQLSWRAEQHLPFPRSCGGIVRMLAAFDDAQHMHIVFEACIRGDLWVLRSAAALPAHCHQHTLALHRYQLLMKEPSHRLPEQLVAQEVRLCPYIWGGQGLGAVMCRCGGDG